MGRPGYASRLAWKHGKQCFRAKVDMLAHPHQLFEHRYTTLRTCKRIAVIAELNRPERRLLGKLLETGKNVFGLDTCKSYLPTPCIAIPTSKGAGFANW